MRRPPIGHRRRERPTSRQRGSVFTVDTVLSRWIGDVTSELLQPKYQSMKWAQYMTYYVPMIEKMGEVGLPDVEQIAKTCGGIYDPEINVQHAKVTANVQSEVAGASLLLVNHLVSHNISSDAKQLIAKEICIANGNVDQTLIHTDTILITTSLADLLKAMKKVSESKSHGTDRLKDTYDLRLVLGAAETVIRPDNTSSFRGQGQTESISGYKQRFEANLQRANGHYSITNNFYSTLI